MLDPRRSTTLAARLSQDEIRACFAAETDRILQDAASPDAALDRAKEKNWRRSE